MMVRRLAKVRVIGQPLHDQRKEQREFWTTYQGLKGFHEGWQHPAAGYRKSPQLPRRFPQLPRKFPQHTASSRRISQDSAAPRSSQPGSRRQASSPWRVLLLARRAVAGCRKMLCRQQLRFNPSTHDLQCSIRSSTKRISIHAMPEQRLRDWFLKQVNLNIKEEFHKINGIEFLPKI